MLNRCCLFILLLFSCHQVFTQQAKQYAFTHFNTTSGLVSNFVYCIKQDQQGYIWIGTIDGLQRYDGNRFITFRHSANDPYSLPDDFIPQLVKDKDGNLWIYTGGKTGYFNTKTFRFTTIPFQGDDPHHPFLLDFVGNAANGYVAANVVGKGLYIYDPKLKTFVPKVLFKLSEKLITVDIKSIDNGNAYWFGDYGALLLYNNKTGNLNYRGHNPDNNQIVNYLQNDTAITAYYGFENNNLWYGSWPLVAYAPFIHVLNVKTGEKKTYSINKLFNYGYSEIGGALFQTNGRKWFYGKTFLAEYTGNEKAPFQLIANEYKDEQSIHFGQIPNMIEDRQHNIWIATDNGVYVFNPETQVFNNYLLSHSPDDTGSEGPVTAACELKNGNVFITTWGRGLFYFDSNFTALPLPTEIKELERPYSIWCIHEHSKTGLMWMGLQGGEIIVYDAARKKMEKFKNDVIGSSTIRQITEDQDGNLWFGMQNGSIVKWNFSETNNDIHNGFTLIKSKDQSYIYKLYTDKDGSVLAGTLHYGLYRYNAKTNQQTAHYTKDTLNKNGLWSNTVYDVYNYNDSLLLIADGALDLLNTKTNNITHISTDNGLPSNSVYNIQTDNEGILWLGMANQLCRFNLEKKMFTSFDKRDGMGDDLFNAAGDYKMKDGRLVYLTDRMFMSFRPEFITTAPQPDNVLITTFKLGNKSLPVDSLNKLSAIDLQYNNTSLSIEFSSLNYTQQNKLQYFYMLDGIDNDWQKSTNNNEAVYNYLPAGDYTFKVKSENTEGKQSAVTELHIHVIPPFWKTWWFLGLIILIVFAAFYFIDGERIKKLQALQNVRRQIAQNLHRDVNTTLNHISLLSEMAKIKADKDVERSKDYIEQISDKSRTMMDSMDDMLWTLNPQNDSMEKTILRMKEYAEAIQNTHSTQVLMTVDDTVKTVTPDMKVRHEIFLVFKKTLHAIAEAAAESDTIINIDQSHKNLVMKIQNSEVKFSGNDALQVIKEIEQRAASIKAELDLQHDNKGISLIMFVPLK